MSEDQHTEWKSTWRDEHLRSICAFANAYGGVLIIGKDDRGDSIGVDNTRRLLEDLPNKIRDVLGILVDVQLRTIEKVAAVCRQAGLEPPTYRMDANGLMVRFQRPADAHGGVNEGVTRSKSENGGVNEGVTPQDAPEAEALGEALGESPRRILTILKQHPQTTISELSDQLEISTTAIEKNIARFKSKGYLERIGGARHGHWRVK